MYIAPSTNIKILKGVPLDSSYDHSLYFENANSQATYFASKAKYTFANNTYQRVNKGTMRIGVCADNIYDCNYMMFQNTNFGSKWFYAFINSVEYVNNDVAEIEYEIDDIQTWFFDFDFEYCFVERQHTRDDEMYKYYEPEPVDVGEYVQINQTKLLEENFILIVQLTKLDLEFTPSASVVIEGPMIYDDCPQGCVFVAFKNTTQGLTTLKIFMDLLNSSVDLQNCLVAMYMVIDPGITDWGHYPPLQTPILPDSCPIPSGTRGVHKIINGSRTSQNDNNMSLPKNGDFSNVLLGGQNLDPEHGVNVTAYKPKNNKLYTFPYNFCSIYNGCGESLSLRYEFGTDNSQNIGRGTFGVKIISNITAPIQTVLTPINYKNVNNDSGTEENFENGLMSEQISLTNYPVCSWSYSAFERWVARDMPPMVLNVATAGLSSKLGIETQMRPKKMTQYRFEHNKERARGLNDFNVFSDVLGTLASAGVASYDGNIAKGNANVGGALVPNKSLTFFSARTTVTAEKAKVIDDFFSMFGYAINRCLTPNRKNRDKWTYIKTKGCHINSKNTNGYGLPADAQQNICNIHDNGITYWVNPSEVGRYDLTNTPLDDITQGE